MTSADRKSNLLTLALIFAILLVLAWILFIFLGRRSTHRVIHDSSAGNIREVVFSAPACPLSPDYNRVMALSNEGDSAALEKYMQEAKCIRLAEHDQIYFQGDVGGGFAAVRLGGDPTIYYTDNNAVSHTAP